jgi:hypothetical protein
MKKVYLAVASALTLAAATPASAATVLTFDGFTNGATVQSVGSVPGLNVSYRSILGTGNAGTFTTPGIFSWDLGYGSLSNVIWAATSGGSGSFAGAGEITFNLTQPGTFTLNSIDYAAYGADSTTSFRVYDLGYNKLFDTGAITAPGSGFATQTFGTTSTTGLILQFGPDSIYTGFDNLSFTASVPEPSTWLMMIAGFGMIGFGLRTRRKQVVRVTYA